MKKLLLLLVAFIGLALPLVAENLFVTAKVCPVFTQADLGSARLGIAKQGDQVQVAQKSGSWIKVTVVGGKMAGYVQAVFLGAAPSLKASETLNLTALASSVDRSRASAYTTSAAAARGLSGENVRERENLAFKDYDFAAIAWLDKFVFSDEEILAFAASEKIGL